VVVVYLLGCFSLSWHLLHGVQSAAQTLGISSKNYYGIIKTIGIVFSIVVPLLFALMPLFVHFGWQINTGGVSLLF
jgi:succinate dehydrogenase / fumarate reductase cytochrome b subunit